MKISSLPLVWLAMASAATANTAPTVVIQSTAMRPGTTLMDVVYRVNDPDDATVKTRALAFVDGTRSFAKVLKPVTFIEGTAAKLGDAIPANVDHKLTWNVAADWNVDLGQVKFEVLTMDQRGLLPFDWITIPAAGGKPAITISKDAPTHAQVLDAYLWQYAAGDPGLALTNGVLRGTAASGVFNNVELANGTSVMPYGPPFIFKRMNLAVADPIEILHAANARAELLNTSIEVVDGRPRPNGWLPSNNWHATNRAYDGLSILVGWASNSYGQITIPAGLSGVTAIAAGEYYSLALNSDGTVVQWGSRSYGTVPPGLSGVTAIAMGAAHSLALKNNGTVVQWGNIATAIPVGLNGVTAIAAGDLHSLGLKSDGTVVAWGQNGQGQSNIPTGLSGITAIAAGDLYSLALKSNGTVVGWGSYGSGQIDIPAGLSGVTAIAAGDRHNLALKSNGTVVAWGLNDEGQSTVPAGLNGVIAISGGKKHSLALKSDGTVIAWGQSENGQTTIPAGLDKVTAIAAGAYYNLALKAKAP